MGALVPHAFEGKALRSLLRDDDPWFVASDAAAFLGYEHTPHLVRLLEDDEKGVHTVDTPGGPQEVSIISEPGLYRVIAQRRATSAIPVETREGIARFQRWLFHDVLPSIRRTGGFALRLESPTPPAVATTFKGYFSIGRLIGLDRNQSALAANRATVTVTGIDPLALMGATHLLAPQQEPILTPTDIGKELGGLSAIAVNNLLAERGLQEGRRDAKDRPYWVPTASGEPFAVFLDTGKKHSDGTPVRQLKWIRGVINKLGVASEAWEAPA